MKVLRRRLDSLTISFLIVSTIVSFCWIDPSSMMTNRSFKQQEESILIEDTNTSSSTTSTTTTTADSTNVRTRKKPKGVFIMKIGTVEDAKRSICILNTFFNHRIEYSYPIRIFPDIPPSNNETIEELQRMHPTIDVQVIIDKDESWKEFPPELSPSIIGEQKRKDIETHCNDVSNCTVRNMNMGYVYMRYWRYRRMAYEESLQEYEYVISIDGDSFITKPWEFDPFQIL